MDKDYDVLCIGLIVADLLVRPVDKTVFDVDSTRIESIELLPGGDALNESIIFGKLGMNVGLAGKIGNDDIGKTVIQKAFESGVNISNVKKDANTRTSTSIVLIGENGDRNFVYSSGNNEELSIDDIDISIIKEARMVSVASLFELPGLEAEGIKQIFKIARENDVITAADVTHDVRGIGLGGIKEILMYTDILLPSYIEAVHLTGERDPEKAADILMSYGPKMIVIKLGKDGCFIQNGQEKLFIKSYETNVVDTTGAGDNFVAAFLTGILKGWHVKKCGMFANAVGSICVQGLGATSSVKSIEQVLTYMNDNKVDL